MTKILLIGMILGIFGFTLGRDLPEFLHVCKRKDPHLGECMKRSIENFRPYLMKGLPDYKIPTLEPLSLEELQATPGGNIKLALKNVLVYGASNYTINRIKANLDKTNFILDISFEHLLIKGDYDVDGKIILLRVRGSGPMNGNFTNCNGLLKVQMELVKGDDGKNYLRLTDIKVKITIGVGTLRLENLFGGDPVLGEAINDAINSNFDAFIQEIQPALESAISNTFTKIGNVILEQFTYETLFPDP